MKHPKITILIPVLNERKEIHRVLHNLPWNLLHEVIVIDSGSSDGIPEITAEHGTRIIHEPQRGYGAACLAGIRAIQDTDIVVFLDGNCSDHPEEIPRLVEPILSGRADLVIGSRVLGKRERGVLTPQAFWGNLLAVTLIRLIYRKQYTDLGPFRAIRWSSLQGIMMYDRNYGWIVEMQILAIRHGLKIEEIPVQYRKKIGKSGVSGTLRGILGVGFNIILCMGWYAVRSPNRKAASTLILECAKYPVPGQVKTRLAVKLGNEEACRIYCKMAQGTHRELLKLQEQGQASIVVYADGADHHEISNWLQGAHDTWLQPKGDLGQRLEYAFCKAFGMGFHKVFAVGTDCPGLTAKKIQKAIGYLKRFDIAIIPSTDGGYVLIGTNSFQPNLFRNITWSSDAVFGQTLQHAKAKHLSVARLDPETDVDTAEDIKIFETVLRPDVSVIIPVLNNRWQLQETLHAFSCTGNLGELEIIVVDGGSTDGSDDVARGFNIQLLRSAPGRAQQMNAGAQYARGHWLWFLHADCRPSPETIRKLSVFLHSADLLWGFFKQHISNPSFWFRFIETGNELRGRIAKLPYGDQGLIVRRDIFFQCGCFPQVPFLEDVLLSRRLSRICPPTAINYKIQIHPHHWKSLGPFFTTVRNLCTVFRLIIMEQSPSNLLDYYLKWKKTS